MFWVVGGALAGGLLAAESCRAQSGRLSSTPSAQSGGSNGSSANGPSQSGASAQNGPSGAGGSSAKDKLGDDPNTTRLKIVVTSSEDKPVGNASVYVRFNEDGGFLHKDKLAELSFKTNEDGTVKVPPVPIGKVLIQVIAKGLHTYGKWYDIGKDPDTIQIKLEKAPHWY
jgi:hypothetical protein